MKRIAALRKQLLCLIALGLGWIFVSLKVEERVELRHQHQNKTNFRIFFSKTKHSPKFCQNVLLNLTVGKWRPLKTTNKNSSYYNAIYRGYRLEREMADKLWRDDRKCGVQNLLQQIPGSTWPRLPSWCNPQSDTPCCNNADGGTCASPNSSTCDCPNCVDMRKYHHAEMCEWKTEDERCAWRYYSTGTEACDVIERSPYNSIHFVGDSLIRNMFYALMMILTDNYVTGTWTKRISEELKPYCRAEKSFFFKCRLTIRSMAHVEHSDKLCGGRKPNFTIGATLGADPHTALMKLVKKWSGRQGSIILLHVGLHLDLRYDVIINNYLSPILKIRQDFYDSRSNDTTPKWPQFYFVPPLFPGLIKPRINLPTQGRDAIVNFSRRVHEFCMNNGVTFFDVRPFSTFVHSFDGTHYGMGVNIMKNQLLLNHFEELST